MNVHVYSEPIETKPADWLVVGLFEEADSPLPRGKIGELLSDHVVRLRDGKDFTGKLNECAPLYGVEGIAAQRVLLVGLGKRERFSRANVYKAAATAMRTIARKPRDRVLYQILGNGLGDLSDEERTALITCGAMVGATGCDLYQSEKTIQPPAEIAFCVDADRAASIGKSIGRGRILAESVNLARELVNLSPAELGPEEFCLRAVSLARECGLDAEVLGPKELAEQKMNCLLAVGQGSIRPPRMLVLRYRQGSAENARTLCLVGKGITFDSGGLSLKTAEGMTDMKCDMAGAATALAATVAIARLELPVNLLCVIPLAENMPSGTATRPGDVLTAKNGKTIEVLNTDAEGRLILADALCHAVDLGASHIVDLATLTGACIVALGTQVAGVMTNRKEWGDKVLAAAEHAGERAWPLPMFDEYDELIRSRTADMKNTGGRWGGAITAAKLLERFVGETPWTHVDIAGPAFADSDSAWQDAGGTGCFVRSLVRLAEEF